jgi:hypothetical protein
MSKTKKFKKTKKTNKNKKFINKPKINKLSNPDKIYPKCPTLTKKELVKVKKLTNRIQCHPKTQINYEIPCCVVRWHRKHQQTQTKHIPWKFHRPECTLMPLQKIHLAHFSFSLHTCKMIIEEKHTNSYLRRPYVRFDQCVLREFEWRAKENNFFFFFIYGLSLFSLGLCARVSISSWIFCRW